MTKIPNTPDTPDTIDPAVPQPTTAGLLSTFSAVLAVLITTLGIVAVTALLQHDRPIHAAVVAAIAAATLALVVAGSHVLHRTLVPDGGSADSGRRVADRRPGMMMMRGQPREDVDARARALEGSTGAVLRDAVLDAAAAAAARERRQDAVRTEMQKLDTAVNNIAHGVIGIDASMRLVLCNDRYLDMYKLSREAAEPGLPLEGLLRRKARVGTFPGDPEAYIRWLADRRATTGEVELADGRIIRISNRPLAVGGWVSTHEDITEQRRAQSAQARTEQLLAAVLDNIPDPVIVKDVHDRRYVLVNRAAETLLGVPRSVVIGKTAGEVFPAATAELIEEQDRKLLSGKPLVIATERAIETPGSGPRVVSARVIPVRDQHGAPMLLLSVIEDRTDRVRRPTRPLRLAAG